MKKQLITLLLPCLMTLLCMGCGQNWTKGDGTTQISNEAMNGNIQGSALVQFDKKLSRIQDHDSAKEAVSFFAQHVLKNRKDTRETEGSSQINAQSHEDILGERLLDIFAKSEFESRDPSKKEGLRVLALEESQTSVSSEKLSRVINNLNPNENVEKFSQDDIEHNQELIRKKIPHLAATNSTTMTPLEASVITYYILTGDDGSNKETGNPLYANPNELTQFSETLLK